MLTWIHRVFGQLKREASGVYHDPRFRHLRAHLGELVFRRNRRRLRKSCLDALFDILAVTRPASHKTDLTGI